MSDGYFAAGGTSLISGRAFASSDLDGSQPVAVVSQKFAQAAWPGRSAVGERIRVEGSQPVALTVIGVAADVREYATSGLDTSVYMPAWQSPGKSYEGLIRSNKNALLLVPTVRKATRVMDATVAVLRPQTLEEIVSASLTATRLPVIFSGAFAMLAFALAVLGVYGIVSYSVTLRTRELGIRTALGGTRADVVRLVLGDALLIAMAGTSFGIVCAAIGSGVLARLLFRVSVHDPPTYVAAAGVLIVSSAAAALIPAARATRIDPVDALRAG